MAISLGTLRKIDAERPAQGVIYGVKGVGKTSLAAQFPSPILLRIGDGENTPKGVSVDGWDINTFDELIEAIGVLFSEDHPFKTAIFDSLTSLEVVVNAETCKRNGWKTLEDPGYGKGYVAAENTWQEVFEGFAALRKAKGMTVLQIGHCEIIRFDSPTTDPYSRYQLDLHKRARALVEANADMILFVNYRATLKKVETGFNKSVTHAEGAGQRIVYTEERPGFIAKNRFDMPPEIPFKKNEGFAALAPYLPCLGE